MQFFLTAWPTRLARASVIALGALAALLLSGCGGGSGINGTSVSDQGFRIVPAGGTVIPVTDSNNNPLVKLVTQPGLVGSGVQVSAVVGTLPSSVPVSSAGKTAAVPGGVYQLTFSPDSPTVTTTDSVTLTLTYTGAPPTNSTLNIYRYDGTTWTALPGSGVSSTAATTGSVTAAIGTVVVNNTNTVTISSDLKSGTYAIFATAAPQSPTQLQQ